MNNLKFIDLCAGIGGFRVAFEDTNTNCILTCEIDKYCQQSYRHNFNESFIENDIKKIDEKNLKDFNILCAGFPCQAFSLAGKQKGLADIRGTIFFDIARILEHKKPNAFILENVKNLKSHDKGKTFQVIQKNLDDLNYWNTTFTINAKYFVPQKRERIYIIGLHKSIYSLEQFLNLVEKINEQYNKQKLKPLPHFKSILEPNVDMKYTLSDKLWIFLQKHAENHLKKGNGFGFGIMNPQKDITSRTLTARYYKDGSEILIYQEGKNPRKLTPRECARLMGYPETFEITVSNTQAYKQFGNSVVVPVIKMFADNIKNILQQE